jgi:hypothetical protein
MIEVNGTRNAAEAELAEARALLSSDPNADLVKLIRGLKAELAITQGSLQESRIMRQELKAELEAVKAAKEGS